MIDILEITLPAIIVLVTSYILMDRFFKNEEKRRNYEIKKNTNNTTLPIRLRAYERIILVLERTTPNVLILNTIKPEMNSLDLQTKLLSTVRNEFAHNVSQQIYVSNELWSAIKITQESIINLINGCARKTSPDKDATVLAELIIKVFASSETTPTEDTIKLLKKEVATLM